MADIEGARMVIPASNGFEQVEFTTPLTELRDAGAEVGVATPDGEAITG